MTIPQLDTNRPIRVVLFCGPIIEPAAQHLVCKLADHPEIEFLGGFCQSEAPTLAGRVKDLWRRRGWLGLPILGVEAAAAVGRFMAHPVSEVRLSKRVTRLAPLIAVVPDLHAEEVLARVQALKPDLGVIYGGPILKPQLFEIPALGTLGIHHGRVPQYRGKKTTFWAMYNGETAAGVTIQRVNAGIDTGMVVKEAEVPIAGRAYRTVWKELEQRGLGLYLEAIIDVRRGEASFRPQRGEKGPLYKDPTFQDLLHFWLKQWQRWWRFTLDG
jgi:folate-dependent phosphoribosylglycinamide formyltransferase PurN